MPALEPSIIEPIWEQFSALLPEREVDHPLGCHRARIPERVVFEKLVEVLVFGCAYWRISDEARLEEDETRRVFYVAPTRARDHLILTCTGLTERLCGLTLLQPGLETANIPVSLVPFEPRDAKPPELPNPSPAEPIGLILAPVVPKTKVVT